MEYEKGEEYEFTLKEWIAEQKGISTEIVAEVKRETPKALCIRVMNEDKDIWIPKSQILNAE